MPKRFLHMHRKCATVTFSAKDARPGQGRIGLALTDSCRETIKCFASVIKLVISRCYEYIY